MLSFPPRFIRVAIPVLIIVSIVLFYTVVADGTWLRLREHAYFITRPTQSFFDHSSTQGSIPQLPPAFYALSDDQKHCDEYYGEQYLRNIAQRQNQYCENGSPSALLAFHANNLRVAGGWETDPVFIARGVRLTREGEEYTPLMSMQCRLRNFTHERLQSEEAEQRLQGINNFEDIGSYYFDTGAGVQLLDWDFVGETIRGTKDDPPCNAKTNNGEWILLARREGNTNLWHKLAEIWQAMHSVLALSLATDPKTGHPYISPGELQSIQVVFEDDRDEYLDDVWTIVTGNKPIRLSELEMPRCQGNIILPLAGSSSPFWAFLLENRDHETCQTRTLLDFFVKRMLDHFSIEARKETDIHPSPVVTIIDRKQTRVFENLSEYVEKLRQRNPSVVFNVVDFGSIPLDEQVNLVQSSDVLVGHHGAGMTHVLFLPPGAAVVEFFPPPKFPVLGFRHVALMRGLVHFVGHSLWREEWDHVVHGVEIPADWQRPDSDGDWQGRARSYVLEEDFVGLVEAAIRNQQFKSARI